MAAAQIGCVPSYNRIADFQFSNSMCVEQPGWYITVVLCGFFYSLSRLSMVSLKRKTVRTCWPWRWGNGNRKANQGAQKTTRRPMELHSQQLCQRWLTVLLYSDSFFIHVASGFMHTTPPFSVVVLIGGNDLRLWVMRVLCEVTRLAECSHLHWK